MIFWTIAGLITLLTIGICIWPVFGKNQTSDAAFEYDKEIYKARLLEIENGRSIGTISENEYEYALAEEGRRLLKLASPDNGEKTSEPKRVGNSANIGIIFAVVAIPSITIVGYLNLGSLHTPDQPLQARLSANPNGQPVEILLQRAENQLMKNPEDGRGWLILAPVYMRLGRADDAATAYRNAIRILGPTSQLQTSLGEALTIIAGGVVTNEANELFNEAVARDSENIKPVFFLGIGLNQAGDFPKALTTWENIINRSPKDAPWLNIARQQLLLAQKGIGDQKPGDPTSQDIQAASELSKSERQDFINSMVERLAQELEENPQNKQGWQRIIRSYTVLKRNSDAIAAINKAQKIFADDVDFIKELEQNKLTLNN